MFGTTWKVEDIFPGWSRTKLEEWGSSDPKFIEMLLRLLNSVKPYGLVTTRRRCAGQSSSSWRCSLRSSAGQSCSEEKRLLQKGEQQMAELLQGRQYEMQLP
jgi:hypothetical protein